MSQQVKVMSKEKSSQVGFAYSKHLVSYGHIESYIKILSGQILTIIDAVVSEERVNKATKDLIKERIRDILKFYQRYCSDGEDSHRISDKELEPTN